MDTKSRYQTIGKQFLDTTLHGRQFPRQAIATLWPTPHRVGMRLRLWVYDS